MSAQAIQPESLGQYLLLVLRGLPRQLGLGLLLRVLVVAPISAAALLLHTWLLVYFNEGVNSDGSFLSQSLALSGFRLLTGTNLGIDFLQSGIIRRMFFIRKSRVGEQEQCQQHSTQSKQCFYRTHNFLKK